MSLSALVRSKQYGPSCWWYRRMQSQMRTSCCACTGRKRKLYGRRCMLRSASVATEAGPLQSRLHVHTLQPLFCILGCNSLASHFCQTAIVLPSAVLLMVHQGVAAIPLAVASSQPPQHPAAHNLWLASTASTWLSAGAPSAARAVNSGAARCRCMACRLK
mgnify:CR=1 FL=1